MVSADTKGAFVRLRRTPVTSDFLATFTTPALLFGKRKGHSLRVPPQAFLHPLAFLSALSAGYAPVAVKPFPEDLKNKRIQTHSFAPCFLLKTFFQTVRRTDQHLRHQFPLPIFDCTLIAEYTLNISKCNHSVNNQNIYFLSALCYHIVISLFIVLRRLDYGSTPRNALLPSGRRPVSESKIYCRH